MAEKESQGFIQRLVSTFKGEVEGAEAGVEAPATLIDWPDFETSVDWSGLDLAKLKNESEIVRKFLAKIEAELETRGAETEGKVKVAKMMIGYWKHRDAQAYAAKLLSEIGDPSDRYYSDHSMVWEDVGQLRKVKVSDKSVPYNIPVPHRIFVEAYVSLRVPPEIVGQIAAVTAAIEVDGLEGYVEARCNSLTNCAVALGWVEDVVGGRAEATLDEYARRMAAAVVPDWFPDSMVLIDVPGYDRAAAEMARDPESATDVAKADGGVYDVTMTFPISKVDDEKRLVTGIVLEPDEVDSQDETITAPVIENAAHKFLEGYNARTRMGLMHQIFGKIGVELVESWIAREDLVVGEEAVKQGSWLMTVRVDDDNLWHKIKTGAITGFSIGGVASVAS